MDSGSNRQGTQPCRPHPGCVLFLVSMVLVLSSMTRVNSPSFAWAAVYQCLDAAGKTLLTNRPSQLNNCHVLSEETAPASTPPATITTPQVLAPPVNSDIPPAPSYTPPLPSNRQADPQGSSSGSLPALHPGMSLSPSSPQPCSRGLNPFNPLSAPPCARSDQSGTNPPGTAPAPSQ